MNECVLVVDDDREIVKAIGLLLEKEGYQVLKAYDGMEALELVAEHPVRLIIMDVMMPKLDGLSAVMKIRERKNLPIIVLSAKSEDTDKVLGLSMGADDYVSKPFNPQELAARVKTVHIPGRYPRTAAGRRDTQRPPLLLHGGAHPLCRRRTGEAYRHGDEDRGSPDAEPGPDLPGGGNLPAGLGGGSLCPGKYGDGPHSAHSGKN